MYAYVVSVPRPDWRIHLNRKVFLALNYFLVITLAVLPMYAGDEGQPVKGLSGPAQGISPTIAKPTLTSVVPSAQPANLEREEHEPGSRVSLAEKKRLKLLAEKPLPTGGKEIHLDSTPTPLAPNLGTNFNGLGQNGWIPYDAAIAVGPSQIVVMTNSQWIVYDRAGTTVRAVTDFGTWWGTPAGVQFDPKCLYDPVGGRFIMMSVSETTTGGNKSFYHLSISQTGDPTGAWYNYQFDATKDGTTSTSNWADFPGLGYDDNAVYITSNQFTFSGGGIFQYAKIRVLSKAQLYAGSSATFTDFVGAALQNSDTSQAFTLQPARTLSSTSSEYFLNTNSNSNNTVTLWRIDGAPASPTVVRQTTYSIGAFTFPPDAPQPGTTTKVATNDDRMYDFVWRSGIIHASFGEAFSGLAAVRYLRLDTTSNTVLKDVTYTQPGVHYYYPAVTDDSAGNLYMVFSRSSSTEFASVYHTGMQPADSAIQASALVKAGVSTNTSGRWGDYSAIANDPADSLAVLSYAGWANTLNRWATWITGATFTGSIPTPTLVSVNPSSGTQGANVNVTLTGLNTHWVQGTSVINISGSGVTASNLSVASATSMTATFAIGASAATGSRNVTVTNGAEVTTSAPFTVNSSTALPTLTSITPGQGYLNTTTTVTLVGTNFVSGMSVNISGTLVTASNINVTSSTQATADFTIAANAIAGNRMVSVTTPGGTSGTVGWTVVGVPVISTIGPNNGNPGAAVAVTLIGAQFYGGSVNISSNGVTPGNVQVKNFGQKITFTATIAANAAAGARNVTAVNGSGTSNAVVFTVNGGTNPPTLASVAPSSGDPGTSVNATLTGTNFTTGSTVQVSGGDVSFTNLNVVNNGQITCTFNINAGALAGPRNVTVTTGAGTSGSRTFTINGSSPLTITTASLANGTVGVAYSAGLSATGGTSPYTWAITVGALPSGLNLAPNTGAISGTPAVAAAGTTNFTVQVTDANLQTATKALSITVNSNQPSVTTVSLPNGQVGTAYNSSVAASGGVTPYTWAVISGALPDSLSLNTNTGAIAGTPSLAGTFNFTVQVTDAFAQIASTPLSITISSFPAPTLSSINPTTGAQGSITPVTFTGTNFVVPATLNISLTGVTASNVVVVNAQTITADLNIVSGAPVISPGQISVTTPGGTTGTKEFQVVGQPALSAISPASGSRGTIVTVTLTGSQLQACTAAITGTGVTISNVAIKGFGTKMTMKLTIAAGAPVGPRNLTVTNAAGTSNPMVFTVN